MINGSEMSAREREREGTTLTRGGEPGEEETKKGRNNQARSSKVKGQEARDTLLQLTPIDVVSFLSLSITLWPGWYAVKKPSIY